MVTRFWCEKVKTAMARACSPVTIGKFSIPPKCTRGGVECVSDLGPPRGGVSEAPRASWYNPSEGAA